MNPNCQFIPGDFPPVLAVHHVVLSDSVGKDGLDFVMWAFFWLCLFILLGSSLISFHVTVIYPLGAGLGESLPCRIIFCG